MLRFGMRIVACVLGMLILSIGYLNAKPLYDYQKIKEIASGKPAKMLDSVKYEKILGYGFDSGLNTLCIVVIGEDGKHRLIRPNGNQMERIIVSDLPAGYTEFVMRDRYVAYMGFGSMAMNICQIDKNGILRGEKRIGLDLKKTMITPAAFLDGNQILLRLFYPSDGAKFIYRILDLSTGKLLNSEAKFGYPVLNNTNEVKAGRIPIIETQVDVTSSWHNRLYVLDGKSLSRKRLINGKKINEKNQVMWIGNDELCFATCDGSMDYINGLWKVNVNTRKQMQLFDFQGTGAMRCMPLSAKNGYIVSEAVNGRKIIYQVDASQQVKSKLLELDSNDVTEVTGNRNLLVIARKTKEFRLYSVD